MQRVIVFDNSDRTHTRMMLSPLTDLRPVFDVRTGAMTTLERMTLGARLGDLGRPDGLIVPEGLATLAREKHDLPVNEPGSMAESVLLVNGACPLMDTESAGVELGEAVVEGTGKSLVKANVRREDVPRVLAGEYGGLTVRQLAGPVPTLGRPWHVRTHRDACITADLAMLVKGRGDWTSPMARVYVAASATVHPSVIFDTESGPILIDEHATLRPGAILVGPVYIGPHSHVLERGFVKANTAIGPHCKVAGEVGGTIIQGYSNKAHDGHLGDSWLGEWVNLGAGTTNSNLLNTYGEVTSRPLAAPPGTSRVPSNERTGLTFFGCVLGDHVKTAICTRIMTGAIVGTGTMYAATAPLAGTIPPFTWHTDAGVRAYRFEKFLEVARAAMSRRKLAGSEAYVERLRALLISA